MKRHGFPVRAFANRFPTLQERCYVACKLATDPLYPAVYEALRDTVDPLLDVGCGMGVLAFYLRQRGWLPAITGVDFDARKIATACRLAAGSGPGLVFLQGDAAVSLPAHGGSVSLLDTLQYFPSATRDKLLRQCAARVSATGVLVIRSGLADDTLRFRIPHGMDRNATWPRWVKAPPVTFSPRAGPFGCAEGAGLSTVTVRKADVKVFPASSVVTTRRS